jgi:hypothetical protein
MRWIILLLVASALVGCVQVKDPRPGFNGMMKPQRQMIVLEAVPAFFCLFAFDGKWSNAERGSCSEVGKHPAPIPLPF